MVAVSKKTKELMAARILIVDDEPINLEITRRTLERAGFEVIEAATGEAGLRGARTLKPDLMLLDVNLPDISGIEVCRQVKADQTLNGVFVVMFSATSTDSDSQATGLEFGADGYITRPIGSRELVARVDAMLRIRNANEALLESEQRFRAVVEHSHDGILFVDAGQRITYYSPSYTQIAGYTPGEMLGHGWREFVHPDDNELLAPPADALAQTPGRSAVMTYRLRHKDGSFRWVETTITNFLDDPSVRAFVLHSREITERKQAEDEIHRLNAELEQRVRERTRELREAQQKLLRHERLAALGQLAGGVGHELRNPLGVITNAVYYLNLIVPASEEKIREYVRIIEQETRAADKIISDLLDFSRIKSVDREPVSVQDLVERTLERYPAPVGIRVDAKIPAGLPPAYVDPRQMVQVLGNLVVNAYQAMTSGTLQDNPDVSNKGGKMTLSAKLTRNEISLSVKDTGCGIPPENAARLFEPLFTTKPRGIGLGLAVSRKLADVNGGRIEVSSAVGKGSTFTIIVPIREVQNE